MGWRGTFNTVNIFTTCSISAETHGTIIPVATVARNEVSNLPQLNTEVLMRTLHQAELLFACG
jgi:hypothetical protein